MVGGAGQVAGATGDQGYHPPDPLLQPGSARLPWWEALRIFALTGAVALVAVVATACVPPGGASSPYHYVLPIAPGPTVGYGGVGSHHDYPAADIFASSGCGTPLVAPIDSRVLELRTVDLYDAAADNPAYRGGRYVSLLGRDGVRYYLAHLDSVAAGLAVGQDVRAGQVVGLMGRSGDASACHLHFGVSTPCPGKEWAVRRGRRVAAALPRQLAQGRHGLARGRGRRRGRRPTRAPARPPWATPTPPTPDPPPRHASASSRPWHLARDRRTDETQPRQILRTGPLGQVWRGIVAPTRPSRARPGGPTARGRFRWGGGR